MDSYLILLTVLSGLGILNSLYITFTAVTGFPMLCLIFPEEECRVVLESPKSRLLGFPNSLVGVALFTTIFVMTLFYSRGNLPLLPLQVASALGFVASLYFLYVQAFQLKAYCTWCLVNLIFFTLLGCLVFILIPS